MSSNSPVVTSKQTRIVRNKQVVKDNALDVNAYAIEYTFTPDAFYDRLAAQLIVSAAGKRSQQQGHWLCLRLKDSVDGVNPANWSREVEKPTIALLTSFGFHPIVAQGLGASAALGVRVALTRTSLGDMVTALRVLIALVCPNLTVCPARSEPFKAFALPVVSDRLQHVEQASAANRLSP